MKRVLVYSHDTFGLGNIRRMLEISRHLVESDPEISVLIITGSPMLHAAHPGIDYVKLPCLSRTLQGGYASSIWIFPSTRRCAARTSSAARCSSSARSGPRRQEALRRQGRARRCATRPYGTRAPAPACALLRDILDSPEATTPVWLGRYYEEAISAYYDEVLVVGTPEVFDLGLEYAFRRTASKITYCGYISRTRPQRAQPGGGAQGARCRCGRAPLLATAGGGEDGFALLRTYSNR